MRTIIIILFVVVLGGMAYVRLAPTNADVWHQRPDIGTVGDNASLWSFTATRKLVVPAKEALQALEQRALATPRTTLIAGSADEGMLTFRTRSLLWGFPDFTTIWAEGDTLVIYARLRFGNGDQGVNRARVREWLAEIAPLTAPL